MAPSLVGGSLRWSPPVGPSESPWATSLETCSASVWLRFVQLAAGQNHSFGLTSSGRILTHGPHPYSGYAEPLGSHNVRKLCPGHVLVQGSKGGVQALDTSLRIALGYVNRSPQEALQRSWAFPQRLVSKLPWKVRRFRLVTKSPRTAEASALGRRRAVEIDAWQDWKEPRGSCRGSSFCFPQLLVRRTSLTATCRLLLATQRLRTA